MFLVAVLQKFVHSSFSGAYRHSTPCSSFLIVCSFCHLFVSDPTCPTFSRRRTWSLIHGRRWLTIPWETNDSVTNCCALRGSKEIPIIRIYLSRVPLWLFWLEEIIIDHLTVKDPLLRCRPNHLNKSWNMYPEKKQWPVFLANCLVSQINFYQCGLDLHRCIKCVNDFRSAALNLNPERWTLQQETWASCCNTLFAFSFATWKRRAQRARCSESRAVGNRCKKLVTYR